MSTGTEIQSSALGTWTYVMIWIIICSVDQSVVKDNKEGMCNDICVQASETTTWLKKNGKHAMVQWRTQIHNVTAVQKKNGKHTIEQW
jgi:hypothetical protein